MGMRVEGNMPVRDMHDDSHDRMSEREAQAQSDEATRLREEERRLEQAADVAEKATTRQMEQEHVEQLVVRDFSVDPEKRLDQAKDLSVLEGREFDRELRKRVPELSEAKIKDIEGFQDSRDGRAFVREGEFSEQYLTAIHEKLHQKSRSELPTALNEGVTEYLARREAGWVGDLRNIDRHGNEIPRRPAYDGEVAVVQKLSGLVGDDTIERAYFQGDTDSLRQHVDADLGEGAFDDICDALEKNDYHKADKRIRRKFDW